MAIIFQTRENGSRELAALGELIEAEWRAALKDKPSAEQERRLKLLLGLLHAGIQPPEQLRSQRALLALEYAGTSDAGVLLQTLAEGAPEARLTKAAKESLERLRRRAAQ